jgi:hypothetical protein
MHAMAGQNVSLRIDHPINVGNVDIEIEVRTGSRLVGRVTISQGGIDWTPARKRKIKMDWRQFAGLMQGDQR